MVGVGGVALKWIHPEHSPVPASPPKKMNIKRRVWQEGRVEGFGGGLRLQTEIVTDSHRTICANDMFQSVSLQYSVLSARGLLACITAFICSNLLAYRGETVEQNYLHNAVRAARALPLLTAAVTFS